MIIFLFIVGSLLSSQRGFCRDENHPAGNHGTVDGAGRTGAYALSSPGSPGAFDTLHEGSGSRDNSDSLPWPSAAQMEEYHAEVSKTIVELQQ